MNAERLHTIATAIRADIQSTKALTYLQQLRDALQNQVSQPQEASHQQQVSNALNALRAALPKAQSNTFPPAWQQVVAEIGGIPLLGQELLTQVDEVFQRNQITPTVAHQEITRLHAELDGFHQAISQVIGGFEKLTIPNEDLSPGQAEAALLVPRAAVDNQLGDFGRELVRLDQTLGTFAELATGHRAGFAIKTVSSTDLTVFLDLAPEVGACLAIGVERIVALYKQLLEIRKLRKDLKAQGLAEPELAGIDKHAVEHMKNGIEPVVEELVEKFWKQRDKARKNELITALRFALNEIANRIDHGYNIDVRAAPPPAADTASDPLAAATAENLATIHRLSPGLKFLKTEGDPVLRLPESPPEERNNAQ